jgi:hypothetical protein
VTVQNKPRDRREHDAGADRFEHRGPRALVGESFGYNLFVGEAIPAGSRDARERLLRYCLRAQLSLERLSVARDGKIVYEVKAMRHGKATQRIMTPLDFMARLVALIPPPYHPILRYFGVFAPHSSWRSAVVPEIDECAEQESEHDHGRGEGDRDEEHSPAPAANAAPSEGVTSPSGHQRSSSTMGSMNGTSRSQALEPVRDGKELLHRPCWYIDWATLLKRVHSVDALRCPCGGRLRFRQVVTDPEVVRSILRSMDLPQEPLLLARARSSTFDAELLPQDWD